MYMTDRRILCAANCEKLLLDGASGTHMSFCYSRVEYKRFDSQDGESPSDDLVPYNL